MSITRSTLAPNRWRWLLISAPAVVLMVGCFDSGSPEAKSETPVASAAPAGLTEPSQVAAEAPAEVADSPSPIERTQLASVDLQPSDQPQILDVPGQIRVTVPPGLLTEPTTLTISSVRGAPDAEIPGAAAPLSYDISLGELHQLDQPLTIEIPFDPQVFGVAVETDRSPDVMRWHPELNTWVALPTEFDAESRRLTLQTDHLSMFNIYAMLHGYYSYEAIWKGDKKIFEIRWCGKDFVDDPANQRVVYVGPDKTNDGKWPGRPPYIRDLLVYLQTAWDKYETDFTMPTRLPVCVLVGKELNTDRALTNQRTRIWGWILINLDATAHEFLQLATAHELFHAVQDEYYTGAGMMARKWWMECTAEYAAGIHVWPGNPWFAVGRNWGYPIWPLDAMSSLGGSEKEVFYNREYHSAVFLEYLMRVEGVKFPDLWKGIAKNWSIDALKSLDAYLINEHGPDHALAKTYPRFVMDWYFNPRSLLPGNSAGAAKMPDTVCPGHWRTPMPQGTEFLENELKVSGGYTALIWKVLPEIASNNKDSRLFVSTTDIPEGMTVTVVHCKGDERPGTPHQLAGRQPSVAIQAEANDTIYVVAVNSLSESSLMTLTARISRFDMKLDPEQIVASTNQPVDIQVKVDPVPPPGVEFHWHFSDGSQPTVTREPTVRHTFTRENTYNLWVAMKPSNDPSQILAKASGQVIAGPIGVLQRCDHLRVAIDTKALLQIDPSDEPPTERVERFGHDIRNSARRHNDVLAEFPIRWNGTRFEVTGTHIEPLSESEREYYIGATTYTIRIEGEVDPTGKEILELSVFSEVDSTVQPAPGNRGLIYPNRKTVSFEGRRIPLANIHYGKIRSDDRRISYQFKGSAFNTGIAPVSYEYISEIPAEIGGGTKNRLIRLEPWEYSQLEIDFTMSNPN